MAIMCSPSWHKLRSHASRAGALWIAGFVEACRIHRAVALCRRSRKVLVKTGQIFVLNGCIFLGSIWFLQRFLLPMLLWLTSSPSKFGSEDFIVGNEQSGGLLQSLIVVFCYGFWLYPIYVTSFVVNCIWYNDIARHAYRAMDIEGVHEQKVSQVQVKNDSNGFKGQSPVPFSLLAATTGGLMCLLGFSVTRLFRLRSDILGVSEVPDDVLAAVEMCMSGELVTDMLGVFVHESVMLQIGEQIYSICMLSVFFLEIFAVSFIPHVGPLLNFVMLSWLYAYYCFDYKWGFARWSLERRLHFFETNWAFFAGFGSPCVLATFFLSPLVSAGVMNVLFPLFVLVATALNPEEVVKNFTTSTPSMPGSTRLPIFDIPNFLLGPILKFLQPKSFARTPSSIDRRKKAY